MSTAPEETGDLSGPQEVAGETAGAQVAAEKGSVGGPELAATTFTTRLWAIIIGTTVVAGLAIFLQVMASAAQAVPGWHPWLIVVNIVVVVVAGLVGLYLFTDRASKKRDPRTVKAIGIALGIYALAQAIVALFILIGE